MEDRLITPKIIDEDIEVDTSLRPKSLGEYIGQSAVKEKISIFIQAANKRQELMERIKNTWKGQRPKIHLSSGRSGPTDKHHADFIGFEDYIQAAALVKDDFDIMMECKEKDLAVLEIIKKSAKEKVD